MKDQSISLAETQSTPAVKRLVERNLVNLRRARNIAMYKLGLAAFLVLAEFLLARFTNLDMNRVYLRTSHAHVRPESAVSWPGIVPTWHRMKNSWPSSVRSKPPSVHPRRTYS